MPLVLFILAVIALEALAPGLLTALWWGLSPLVASREFFLGLFGSSLAAGLWMSLGQTSLARRQYDAAIKKAEEQYSKDKGWF